GSGCPAASPFLVSGGGSLRPSARPVAIVGSSIRLFAPSCQLGVYQQRANLIERGRLGQMLVETGLLRAMAVLLAAIAGDRDQQNGVESRVTPDRSPNLVAIHPRQANVEQDDFGAEILELS